MSELTFTLARLGFLLLLWLLIFAIVRVLRRDVADPSASPSLTGRSLRSTRLSRRAAGEGEDAPKGRRRQPSRLVITEGPLAGSTVPLSPTSLTIGRAPGCSLVLEDSYASSQHARIFPKDGAWWLEDLGSTNGTTLAGHPVTGIVELPLGIPVKIGQTTLELRS